MALRFLDSFDHYLAADATLKWTTAGFQGRGTGLHGSAMRGVFSKGMIFSGNTIIQEMFINRINIPMTLFGLFGTEQDTQVSCDYNNAGSIEVKRWGGPTLFTSAPDLIRTGTWYHFGWKVFVHPTAGTVEVRLNGETICNLTGIGTTNQLYINNPLPQYWSGTLGGFTLGDNGNACWFDDLVVMDAVDDGLDDPRLPGGGGFDKFLGPVEIAVKRSAGPGAAAEWTPTPTAPNWQNVDDPTPDGDTTYNGALPSAVGASDLFAMEPLASDEDVVAVQSLILARKTDEGTAAIAPLVRDAGTTTVGATAYQPSAYSYLHRPEPTLPGGAPWTKARWDAIQYGYRRVV